MDYLLFIELVIIFIPSSQYLIILFLHSFIPLVTSAIL